MVGVRVGVGVRVAPLRPRHWLANSNPNPNPNLCVRGARAEAARGFDRLEAAHYRGHLDRGLGPTLGFGFGLGPGLGLAVRHLARATLLGSLGLGLG